jgi:hypothetical protein
MKVTIIDQSKFNKSRKPIEAKPIDDLTIDGGAAEGLNIKKEVIVQPAKKNHLPMIIGVVVI